MTTTDEPARLSARTPEELAAWDDRRCAVCGSELTEDQEWCLECGAARTLVHRPPDPRVPLAVVATVVLLVLAGFAVALTNTSSNADRLARQEVGAASRPSAATAPPRPAPTPARPTPNPSPSTSPARARSASGSGPSSAAGLGTWPVGLSGWTVVLEKTTTRAAAVRSARALMAGGLSVGVLDTSRHPALAAGFWLVFHGRYPDRSSARAAMLRLRAAGHASARARLVAPPGGL